MSWPFLASLTLGALVVWLAVGVGAYRRRLRKLAKDARKLSKHRL